MPPLAGSTGVGERPFANDRPAFLVSFISFPVLLVAHLSVFSIGMLSLRCLVFTRANHHEIALAIVSLGLVFAPIMHKARSACVH